jgi:hypothetical protein
MTDIPTLPMTGKTLRVLLPDGIGYVEIRTGRVHGPTGYPVVAVEAVSYTIDTPAGDGRMYEQRSSPSPGTILLLGYPGPATIDTGHTRGPCVYGTECPYPHTH